MRRTLLPLLLLALGTLAAARAQAQERPALLINSGVTIPTTDYGDFHRAGLNLGVGLELEMTPRLMFQGTAAYYTLPVLFEQGRESGLIAMVNLKFLVLPEAEVAVPYLLGGIGVWRTGFSDLWFTNDGITQWQRRVGEEESRFATSFGTGASIALSERVGFFAQARYVIVSGDDPRIQMLPLELGLSVHR